VNANPSDMLASQWGPVVHALVQAYKHSDAAALTAILQQFASESESQLRREVATLSDALRAGLDRLGRNETLARLAQQEMPDARARLEHVVKLTEDGAHRTLELVERSMPCLEHIRSRTEKLIAAIDCEDDRPVTGSAANVGRKECADALLATSNECRAIHVNLVEVMTTQAYQDLSGQIIRGVIAVVGELESALGELMRICGQEHEPVVARGTAAHGFGPVVPGVSEGLTQQQDVDAIIADLGI